MLSNDDVDRKIIEQFSALTEENQAVIFEILLKSLSEQAKILSGQQSNGKANP